MKAFKIVWSVLLGVGGVLISSPSTLAQQVYTAEPPEDIACLLTSLKSGKDHTAEIRALASRDDAAPYIRRELLRVTGRYKQDLVEALGRIEKQTWERNKVRFGWWAKTGRLDLCAELIVVAPTDADAHLLAVHLSPVLDDVMLKSIEWTTKHTPHPGFTGFPLTEYRKKNLEVLSGEKLVIDKATNIDRCTIRADRCVMGTYDPSGTFAVVRSEFTYTKDCIAWWNAGVVLANCTLPVRRGDGSLFITSEDVVIENGGGPRLSVIIAGGDVRIADGQSGNRGEYNTWYASGNIVLSKWGTPGENRYHAMGKVEFRDKLAPTEAVKENQKCLPFGVRFLDPAEFGLELGAPGKGGVPVKGVAPDSVFAKYDVRAGDVITHADSTPVASVAEFRRKLRTGVVRESLTLTLTRDGKTITRIVFLDGVPVPTAPAPRPR